MDKRTAYLVRGALVLVALSACGQLPAGTGSTPGMAQSTGASTSPSAAASTALNNGGAMNMASPSASMSPATMPSMDHGSMDHGGMLMGTATATANAPFDAMFIDSMITHHQGATMMANQALTQAQRPEIKQLAQDIIAAQNKEIGQMRQWRQQWYADVPQTGGMNMAMGDMTVSSDPSTPFDQRFMQAMIPHHQSATMMAQMAQQHGEHPEIKQLANDIITAQNKEIGQMRQWLQAWYGVTQ